MGNIIVPKLVLVESPFRGDSYETTGNNILYARLCMRDSFLRGENPIASHLLYTQIGILDDTIEEERRMGIDAGLAWGINAELSAFYIDKGISDGMKYGRINAEKVGREIAERSLGSPEEVASMIERMAKVKPFINTGILF